MEFKIRNPHGHEFPRGYGVRTRETNNYFRVYPWLARGREAASLPRVGQALTYPR